MRAGGRCCVRAVQRAPQAMAWPARRHTVSDVQASATAPASQQEESFETAWYCDVIPAWGCASGWGAWRWA